MAVVELDVVIFVSLVTTLAGLTVLMYLVTRITPLHTLYRLPRARSSKALTKLPGALLIVAFVLFLPLVVFFAESNFVGSLQSSLFDSKIVAKFASPNSDARNIIISPSFERLAASMPFVDIRRAPRGSACGPDNQCFDVDSGEIIPCPGAWTGVTYNTTDKTIPNAPWFLIGFFEVCGAPVLTCPMVDGQPGVLTGQKITTTGEIQLYCTNV